MGIFRVLPPSIPGLSWLNNFIGKLSALRKLINAFISTHIYYSNTVCQQLPYKALFQGFMELTYVSWGDKPTFAGQ